MYTIFLIIEKCIYSNIGIQFGRIFSYFRNLEILNEERLQDILQIVLIKFITSHH